MQDWTDLHKDCTPWRRVTVKYLCDFSEEAWFEQIFLPLLIGNVAIEFGCLHGCWIYGSDRSRDRAEQKFTRIG